MKMNVYTPPEEEEGTLRGIHTKLKNKAKHSTVNTGLSNRHHRHAGLGGQWDDWLSSVLRNTDMEENLYVKDKKDCNGHLNVKDKAYNGCPASLNLWMWGYLT